MKLFGLNLGFSRKATELTYDQVAGLIDGSYSGTVAGIAVTDKAALQVSTVLSCVKAIADGCATPPLHVYREKDDGGRARAVNIPEYRLLHRRPNEWQTSYEWRRLMTMHAALTGTGLSVKVRGDNRRVRELIPVPPGQWSLTKTSRYEAVYRCYDEFGLIGEFKPEDVFVLRGVQWNWLEAMDAVRLARSAIGLALATEKSQAAFHANGLRPSGTYTVEGTLNKEQYDRLTEHITQRHSGPGKTGLPMILDRAAKWFSTAMTGVDAQHVETRRLQIEEICRAYNVFPIMVGHSDKSATFASSEAFFSAHLKHTLTPWHENWTQRIDETLLDGSGPLFAEFDVRYLRAGDMKDRAQWSRTMAEMGIYTRNELRDEEGKDPLPGLDAPLTPMNMGGKKPAGQAGEDDDTAGTAPSAGTKALLAALQIKVDAALAQRNAQPLQLNLNTDAIERHLKAALEALATAHAEHIKTVASEMPITIHVPPQPAPDVHVTVQPAEVHFEATVPPATVVINGPKSSTQKVERDAEGEILQTTTSFVYPQP